MKHIFLVALLLCGLSARAQAPAWQALVATNQTSGNFASASAMATATNGDVYIAGSLSGTVGFGSITVSGGSGGLFLAKWSNASRSFAWVQQASFNSELSVVAIAVSGSSIYVTGTFMGTGVFGAETVVSAGAREVFVAKLADAGSSAQWAWAQRAGGGADDKAFALAVQGPNVYVGGYCGGSAATFGAITLSSAAPNSTNGFVAKLSDAGTTSSFLWAQRVGDTGSEAVHALAVNGPAVYLAASYSGGSFGFGASTLPATSSSDVFVGRLTDMGTAARPDWAQPAGGSDYDEPTALAVRGTSVYVAGSFQGPAARFGASSLSAASINSDVFVAKLTDAATTGGFVWAVRAGGTSPDVPSSLVVSGSDLYIAGMNNSASADFGSTTLTGAGSSDVFVARLLDGGATATWEWAQRAGGAGADGASAVALQGSTVYVAGYVAPVANFGSLTVAGPTSQPGLARSAVAFLASLTDPILTAVRPTQGSITCSLLPNPAHARARVQVAASTNTTTATLVLRDILGRTVRTYSIATNTRVEVDLLGLVPGIYAVQVTAGAETATRRLVVE